LLALAAAGLTLLPAKGVVPARAGPAIAVAALGHFAVFSLVLHNPLWAEQAVGDWPIVNLLLASYGLAIGLVLWLRRRLAPADKRLRTACDAATMALITLGAFSELRQIFSGSVLLGPIGQQEDLLRSILAIAV